MPAIPVGFTFDSNKTARFQSLSLISSPLKTIRAFSFLKAGVSQCFTDKMVIIRPILMCSFRFMSSSLGTTSP